MLFFIALLIISLLGFFLLFVRHILHTRSLKEEEIRAFLRETPSFTHQFLGHISPIRAWLSRHFFYLFYHATEWVVKLLRAGLMLGEERLRLIGDYLHGRKIFFHKKRHSPFWASIHEWRKELKNGNGISIAPSSHTGKEEEPKKEGEMPR